MSCLPLILWEKAWERRSSPQGYGYSLFKEDSAYNNTLVYSNPGEIMHLLVQSYDHIKCRLLFCFICVERTEFSIEKLTLWK